MLGATVRGVLLLSVSCCCCSLILQYSTGTGICIPISISFLIRGASHRYINSMNERLLASVLAARVLSFHSRPELNTSEFVQPNQTYKAVPLLCCTKRLFTHVSCHRSMHTYPLQPDVPVSLLFFTARVLLRSRNDAQSIYTFRLRKRKCHSGRVCCQGHFIQPGRWLLVGAFRYVWEGRGRRTTRGGRCNPHKYTRHLTQTFLPTHCRNTATKGRSPWTSSPSSRPRSWTCASRPSGASTRTVRTGAFLD